MRGSELMRRAVWSAEGDRYVELTAAHRQHIGRVVHHLIERDKREAKGHELDDRAQTYHGGTDSEPGKSILGDGRVDNSFWTEAFEQPLRDFVGTIVLRHFFAHEENIRIAFQFFRQRFVQSLPISDLAHFHCHNRSQRAGRGGSPEPPASATATTRASVRSRLIAPISTCVGT